MSHSTDTIVAVSSPPGMGWRGLVRLSGPQTPAVLAALIESAPGSPRLLRRVTLRSPRIPALCVAFDGGSYTGEAMAELQLPGNPALLERVVRQALGQGARPAEPGEFTFRAFLGGRIDLTQAEGVAATIAATSDAQLHAAAVLRGGELGRLASQLVDRLATQLALVEAGIDFTDQEDVAPIASGELDGNLAEVEQAATALLRRSRPWQAIESLPSVVLAGAPSTGKSTLFNTLLGRPRAVISAAPGTTRDILREPLRLTDAAGRPVEVMLVDVAGLDDPAAPLDRQAQAAARDALARADLILQVNDPAAHHDASTLHIRTMADLGVPSGEGYDVVVSALTGAGLDGLRRRLADRVGARGVSVAADMLALQPRHEAALHAATDQLRHARAMLAPHLASHALPRPEHLAAALRAALDDLAALGGRMSPDDIIGRIFATFCVGK